MFPRLLLAIVVYLPACLLAQSADPTLDDRDVHTTCGSAGDPIFPWIKGCVATGTGGPLDIQSIGPNTQTNGADNGHPAPTLNQPPQTTPPQTHPTARTGEQQQNQPTATNDPSGGSPSPSSTGISGDPSHAINLKQTSETTSTVATSTVEGSNSKTSYNASQSLTQLPSSSSSLGGALQRHGTSKGRIVGAILGSIIGAVIIVAVVFLMRRRRRRHRQHSSSKLGVLIAAQREQEREPSIHDPRYQRNRGFYLFNHIHRPDDRDIDVERRLSRTSYSSSSFSLTTSADTIMEEKLNFKLNHPL